MVGMVRAPPAETGERSRGAVYGVLVRALGVTCTPRVAYLSLAVEGAIVPEAIERLEVASQYEASAELVATLDDVKRAYAELRPDAVAVLKPEKSRRGYSYDQLASRVALETLLRIAAVQESIDIELLPRATVRARLGIPKSGDLASHVGSVVPEPVGHYWSAGRDVAGLAALAIAPAK